MEKQFFTKTEQINKNVINKFNTTNQLYIINDKLVNDFLNKSDLLKSLIEKEIYYNSIGI